MWFAQVEWQIGSRLGADSSGFVDIVTRAKEVLGSDTGTAFVPSESENSFDIPLGRCCVDKLTSRRREVAVGYDCSKWDKRERSKTIRLLRGLRCYSCFEKALSVTCRRYSYPTCRCLVWNSLSTQHLRGG